MPEDGSSRPLIKSTASGKFSLAGFKLSTRLLLVLGGLALICLIPIALADPAPNPIATSPNGTSGVVSGGLYVNATQPTAWGDQASGVDHRQFIQNYDGILPADAYGNNVKWARLYAVVYSGSGVNNWPLNWTCNFSCGNGTTVCLDNNLTLQQQSGTDGHCYWIDDHCTKVYSDYMLWYDVTGLIADIDPSVTIDDYKVGTSSFDGRLKAVQLVIAYNVSGESDGDTYYWVNQGQEWFNGVNGAFPYLGVDSTTFDTSALSSQTASSATLTELSTSSGDGYYHIFNLDAGNELTRDTDFQPYINHHAWDVTSKLSSIPGSTLFYFANSPPNNEWGGSYQIQTATLAIRI
jgi:hypothetical protein